MSHSQQAKIKCAALERTVALSVENGFVAPVRTPEWNLINLLESTRELVQRIMRDQSDLFRVVYRRQEVILRPKALGQRMLAAAIEFEYARSQIRPSHRMDPLVSLMIEECDHRGIGASWMGGGPRSSELIVRAADSLNGCVNVLRRKGRRQDFKKKVDRWTNSFKERFNDITDYFDAVVDANPAARLSRIDFGYRPSSWGLPLDERGVNDSVTANFQSLLAFMKAQGPCVVGYAWKRDYGVARGPILHLVLVIDGPREQDLDAFAYKLMLAWQREITGGLGVSYNCLPAGGSPFSVRGGLAIQEFHPGGLTSLLDQAAVYLVMADQLLVYDCPGNTPAFGKGEAPYFEHGYQQQRSWPFVAS